MYRSATSCQFGNWSETYLCCTSFFSRRLKARAIENWVRESTVPNRRGNYVDYYAAMRDAIRGAGPNPVPPEQAVALMELLDLGARSAREGRALNP